MANIPNLITKSGYEWKFSTVGGVTRVNIETGEDIAHLDELDQKLWTVLSCPVKGLEFDEQTLTLMDSDGDGKIRVNEVVATSKWLVSVLKDSDKLLAGDDQIALSDINETAAAPGTKDKVNAVVADLKAGKIKVFATDTFTVNGAKLDSYKADVDTDKDYTPDTEVIADGYFHESEKRSAPAFDLRIDGIELLNEKY